MPTNRSDRSRPHLILARWLGLICCGVVAGAVVIVLEPSIHRLCAPIANRLGMVQPLQAYVLLSILAFTACWFVGHKRWRGFLGIRFLFAYPPLWVAIIIGLGTWLGGTFWLHGIERVSAILDDGLWFQSQVHSLVWWFILVVLAVLLTFATLRPEIAAKWRGGRDTTNGPQRDEAREYDFDELRDWLRDDSEVAKPAGDRFDYGVIVRRIVDRLMGPDEAPTMAVVGPLGSGKSTIRRLVAYGLRHEPTVRLVEVSVWPFDSAEAAVRGILRSIVRELGRHVNVLPLVGLSNDYVTAIEKTAGSYGGIARLLRGSSDPEQILQRFSDIACAAGLRLVLWIEDLERFSGGDQLEGEQRIEREVERLGPIRALLHLLDRCPQISVVISDTSLRTRFDIGKIARFVEQTPPMDAEHVWNVTALLRDRCLGGYPVTVIDPASRGARELLTLDKDVHRISAWMSGFRDSHPSIPAAVAHTLRTPRALKSALRITLETWEKMPGEVDLDSVLVASVLRVAHPELFALINEHVEVLREGLRDPFAGSGEKKPHRVVEQIDKLLSREDERAAAALKELIHFLFPKYPPEAGNSDREYICRPQALSVNRFADYWRRYLAPRSIPDSESDQKALIAIHAWRNCKPSDLIDRLVDPQRVNQIAQFIGQFKPVELCRLLTDVCEHLQSQSAKNWEDRVDAPGVAALCYMLQERRASEDKVFETVAEIMRRFVPNHLPLVYDVARSFVKPSSGMLPFMSDEQQEDAAKILRDGLTANFLGNGAEERLLQALRDGSPYLISGVAWFARLVSGDQTGSIPFERWADFANVLLNLAETHPAIAVSMIVPLITRSNMTAGYRQNEDGTSERVGRFVGQFHAESAKRLFDFDRLIPILASFDVPDDLGEDMKERCRAAVEAAQAHT